MNTNKYFRVSGTVYVDREDCVNWLQYEGFEVDDDYEPTDREYLACAYDLFHKNQIDWRDAEIELDEDLN